MDGEIIVAIVTGSIFIIGGGIGLGKMLQKQNGTDARLDTVNSKVDSGFKSANEKADKAFAANDKAHMAISQEIGESNERISRIEGYMNGKKS